MKNAAPGPLPLFKLVYNSQKSRHIWSRKNKKGWFLAWRQLKYCLNWRIKNNGLWKTVLASFAKHSFKLLDSIDLILHISYFGFAFSIVLLIFLRATKCSKFTDNYSWISLSVCLPVWFDLFGFSWLELVLEFFIGKC